MCFTCTLSTHVLSPEPILSALFPSNAGNGPAPSGSLFWSLQNTGFEKSKSADLLSIYRLWIMTRPSWFLFFKIDITQSPSKAREQKPSKARIWKDVTVRGVYFDFFVESSFCGFIPTSKNLVTFSHSKPSLVQESIPRQKGLPNNGIDQPSSSRVPHFWSNAWLSRVARGTRT